MSNSMLNISIKCDKCGNVADAMNAGVIKKIGADSTYGRLTIVKFECNCGYEEIKQVDTVESIKVLKEVKRLLRKKIIQKNRGKSLGKENQKKFEELRKELKKLRFDNALLIDKKEIVYDDGSRVIADTNGILNGGRDDEFDSL